MHVSKSVNRRSHHDLKTIIVFILYAHTKMFLTSDDMFCNTLWEIL